MNDPALQITRVKWYPEAMLRDVDRLAGDSEEAGAQRLLDAANERVPYASGDLLDSGTITRTEDGAVVSYSVPYAPILRAHPDWDFQGGRSGRWLDEAVEENGEAIGSDMADHVRAGWPG